MFAELPSLFGRAFAVGFFLPAAVTLSALAAIAHAFGFGRTMESILTTDLATTAAIAAAGIWLFAVALMALNRSLIRLLEGYGSLNPFQLVKRMQISAFEQLQQQVSERKGVIEQARANGEDPPQDVLAEYAVGRRRLAEEFPHMRQWVLPTRFGNVLRAFEVYSSVVYGLDAIPAWERLVAVVPEHYRTLIDDAKSQMDFFVNLWFGSCLCLATYAGFAGWKYFAPYPWIPVVALPAAVLAAQWARAAARQWGVLVMSAFDLYRGTLCKSLGLRMPGSIEAEREMWTKLSQMMIYRSREAGSLLNDLRIPSDVVDRDS